MQMDNSNTHSLMPGPNQENNQLLLNAIKNKFAAQNSGEEITFSPPKFSIPTLRAPVAMGGSAGSPSTTSQLNQFILGQLNEKRTNGELSAERFTLPKLLTGNQANSIPLHITHISNRLSELKVSDEAGAQQPAVIDLTTALSCSPGLHTNMESRLKVKAEDFEIPFIECDRRKKPILLDTANEYCHPDVSYMKLRHSLVAASSCGRVLCLKYRRTRPMPSIDHSFKVKHKIQRFRFDTKSPDDVVLATLNKYQR